MINLWETSHSWRDWDRHYCRAWDSTCPRSMQPEGAVLFLSWQNQRSGPIPPCPFLLDLKKWGVSLTCSNVYLEFPKVGVPPNHHFFGLPSRKTSNGWRLSQRSSAKNSSTIQLHFDHLWGVIRYDVIIEYHRPSIYGDIKWYYPLVN